MISHTVKTSLLWTILISRYWKTWHLEIVQRKWMYTWTFHVFYFGRDVWKWKRKHITVNFLQVIHRFVYDITVNFLGYSQLKFPQREKTIEILILTLFTAFTTILYVADRKIPMGEIARARIITDEETEIFPSELHSRIVVLLAIRIACTT